MSRPVLMRTPQQLADDFAYAYRKAQPAFAGWSPGIGWARLCGWLSKEPEFDYHNSIELKEDCDQVAQCCPELLSADYDQHKVLFPDKQHAEKKPRRTYPW